MTVDHERGEHATLSGVIDTVYTQPVGSVLAADALTGSATVSVDDLADFDEDIGGTLSLGGSTYTYTVTDADTGELTLGATLAADASEGDRVDVWDTGLDQAAIELRAHVALPGSQASDDYIDGTVAQSLAVQLEEGLRDPGTEESVTLTQRGLEWVVTDVRGKKPKVQSGSGGQNVITGDSEATATVSISQTLTGSGTSVGGNHGVSVGDESNSTGSENTALGHQAQANGTEDTAVGKSSVAGTGTESGATAVGARAAVTANNGTAVGFEAGVTADGATSIGAGVTCATPDGVAIGATGQLLGFLGATPVAQAATPTTLGDVIAILQAFGLCS